MAEQLTIDALFANADWRLCYLDSEKSTATFNKLSRTALTQNNFADHAFLNQQPGDYVTVPLQNLLQHMQQTENLAKTIAKQKKQKVHYIFHSAFCGSTLLARVLDEPGKCLSIREPHVLTQLSAFKRANQAYVEQWSGWPQLLKLSLYFIARGYHDSETTIIKPSNSANNLIPDLLDLNSNSQALMLSASLKQFLVSNLKKGEGYKRFCHTLANQLNQDTGYWHSSNQTIDSLMPLQQAALVWHMHQLQFTQATNTLFFDQFMADKSATLNDCNRLFALGLSTTQIDNKLDGELFKHHAKEQKGDYTEIEKGQEDAKILFEHGEQIERTMRWLQAMVGVN